MSTRASLVLIVLAACAVSEEAATTAVEQGAWNSDCEEWGCGANSPEIDNLGLHELPLDFTWSPDGWRIMKITMGHLGQTNYNVKIWGAHVSATPVGGGATLTGHYVEGLVFHVEHVNGTQYYIQLAERSRTTMWAKPGGSTYVTNTYLVNWDIVREPNSTTGPIWKNICSNPKAGSGDNLGMNEFYAVLFEGDRIDAKRKQVYGINNTYFNIGCAGHALAKLHLTGHTQGARQMYSVFATDLSQRTTMLKMLTADYCGTGTAFTVAGEPLQWKDSKGWMGYSSAVSLEARWDRNGATCLQNPRLSTSTYPDLMSDIKAACGGTLPPHCRDADNNTNAHDLMGKHLVSANPTPIWFP